KWNKLTSNNLEEGQELELRGVYDDVVIEEVEEVSSQSSASAQETTTKTEQAESNQSGQTLSVTATAYTAKCAGCSGITYTGVDLNANPNAKVIAVDPNVIPLGTEVYVEGYGNAIAADIGGAIKGNRIDIHVPTKDEAFSWGRRTVEVTILN